MASSNFATKSRCSVPVRIQDLRNPGTDARHRLRVARSSAELDRLKLESGAPPRVVREAAEVGQRTTDPHNGLLFHRLRIQDIVWLVKTSAAINPPAA